MTEVEMRAQIQLDAGVLNEAYWQGARITNMLNQAQRWLQQKLIAQGFKNWESTDTISIANSTYMGLSVSVGTLPFDQWLKDKKIEWILPNGSTALKPAKEIDSKNVWEVTQNTVLQPSSDYPAFWLKGEQFYIYPQSLDSDADLLHVAIVDALVYDDSSTESTIPLEWQEVVIERVVMQIKSNQGNEQVKQAMYAEIDNELTKKYQLDALKNSEDKETTQ